MCDVYLFIYLSFPGVNIYSLTFVFVFFQIPGMISKSNILVLVIYSTIPRTMYRTVFFL